MMHTEEEAKEKNCPIGTLSGNYDGNWNKGNCGGPRCMLWRWLPRERIDLEVLELKRGEFPPKYQEYELACKKNPYHGPRWEAKPTATSGVTRWQLVEYPLVRGYCGLAGKA